MQVRSANSAFSPNFTRKSTTGMTRPRRLITPFTKDGTWGTGVIFCIRMISLTFSTAIPYASLSRTTVRYFPASDDFARVGAAAFDMDEKVENRETYATDLH